jgi:DNA-binding response OmpR family regulator
MAGKSAASCVWSCVFRGFKVDESGAGRTGGEMEISTCKPELVILDPGLSGMDDITAISKVRELSAVSTIVLSARNQVSNNISALDAGADDDLTKPSSIVGELLTHFRVSLHPF